MPAADSSSVLTIEQHTLTQDDDIPTRHSMNYSFEQTGMYRLVFNVIDTTGSVGLAQSVIVDVLPMGDVNNDCHINTPDVDLLICYILGGNCDDIGTLVLDNADLNHDGSINIWDITLLVSRIEQN